MNGRERVVRLGADARAVVEAAARRRYPEESCGGLLGRVEEGGRRSVVLAVPARNRSPGDRGRRYLLDPGDVLAMQATADERGLEVLGFFHSHPDHPAEPSETDRTRAWPWYSYLIVSVIEGEPGSIRSWRLAREGGDFREEVVELEGGG